MNEQTGQVSPYAYLLSAAFMIWMLVDAWRRRAPLHWYFIIVVMPFGSIFYFVMVKLRDYRAGMGQSAFGAGQNSVTAFSSRPSPLQSDLDQADALEARDQYVDAEPLYRAALAADPANRRALHGLGRCLLGQEKAKDSLPYFEKVLELEREFRNFGAALDYADALWAADQKSDAIELLEGLCATTDRINHWLALSHYLAEFGQVERAKRELEQALAKAAGPTAPFNDRHQQWVVRGRQMLAALEARFPETPSDLN
jgi:hypothetical protein